MSKTYLEQSDNNAIGTQERMILIKLSKKWTKGKRKFFFFILSFSSWKSSEAEVMENGEDTQKTFRESGSDTDRWCHQHGEGKSSILFILFSTSEWMIPSPRRMEIRIEIEIENVS